jgi:hypothetical protein
MYYIGIQMAAIRFKFAPKKALAALHWMVSQQPRADLHTLLKACYFADKRHLNKHHRPVFGATYQAMRFGPVPLEIYEMLKGEVIWLAELDLNRYPWRRDGYHIVLRSSREPDMSVLSKTDMENLRYGFEKSNNMNFSARTAATHGRDWQQANLGIMRYEDMLDETNHKAEIIESLEETARFLRL